MDLSKIEVFARAIDNLQWVCSSCGNMHSYSRWVWDKAKVRCVYCSIKYKIGLRFSRFLTSLPPHNAVYVSELKTKHVNRLEGQPIGIPGTAAVRGRLDWACPACGLSQRSKLNWEYCSVECIDCQRIWYVQVIIYKAMGENICPFDWSVPREGLRIDEIQKPQPSANFSTSIAEAR